MSSPWVRAIAAGAVVVLVAASWYFPIRAGGDFEISLEALIVVLALVCVPIGYAVGRWWVVPLAFVPVLALLPFGVNPDDSDLMTYSAQYFWWLALPIAVFLLLGYLLRVAYNVGSRALRKRRPKADPRPSGS